MRTDESGSPCPSTLGEYRDLCAAIGGEACPAVKLLDDRIKAHGENGRNEEVVVPDSQMRELLMPRLVSDCLRPVLASMGIEMPPDESVPDISPIWCANDSDDPEQE